MMSCKKEQPITETTDFCANIHRDDSTSLSKELSAIKEDINAKTGVYVLEDGSGSMVARAWLTEYAEKTIDIQYFIFSMDNVGLIAVSYTHLRAHETVLDLVCRLLLEKKKTQ